ncbi:MAG: hypothetical protein A2W99_14425 [Bacteroidetes bacterium GWF2_33_16]|nr:MAG: hypothetical protein A2X00_08635 [Bacteroidetes bacterium GWE2_32_14]OFY04870.1 MAG: hypothetical protein A2W99_14425 [Bacteroidetes bacterium GWF2_33_16]
MKEHEWIKEINIAINVCNKEGNLLFLNDKAIELFKNDGGEKLIGQNIINCHPEKERQKLIKMLNNPNVNCYTIERTSGKKLIYQAPWYVNGTYMGYTEFIIELPISLSNKKIE